MERNSPIPIAFKGLKIGEHQYHFRVDGMFFTEFDNTELADSAFNIDLSLEKKESHMEVQMDIRGDFHTECDRCLGELQIPMELSRQLVVKEGADVDDEDMIDLKPQDDFLDLSASIYESIAVALPYKRAHEEADCDPAVLEKLDQYSLKDSEENDPRWDALKKLKD